MTDGDGHRIEAALQFGFEALPDMDGFTCTPPQLIAFAKACERKGRAEAIAEMERVGAYSTDQEKGALGVVIYRMQKRNDKVDAELAPLLEAERVRSLTADGYVRGPDGRWVKP